MFSLKWIKENVQNRKITSIVHKGDRIPFDGEIVDGCALVDESAETGVSKPTLLDNTPGRNNVLAGSLIVDGWIVVVSDVNARQRT